MVLDGESSARGRWQVEAEAASGGLQRKVAT